jgi:hypothetical protein
MAINLRKRGYNFASNILPKVSPSICQEMTVILVKHGHDSAKT